MGWNLRREIGRLAVRGLDAYVSGLSSVVCCGDWLCGVCSGRKLNRKRRGTILGVDLALCVRLFTVAGWVANFNTLGLKSFRLKDANGFGKSLLAEIELQLACPGIVAGDFNAEFGLRTSASRVKLLWKTELCCNSVPN